MAAIKSPQIIPVIHNNELFVAWQTWDRTRPTGKVFVSKVSLDSLENGAMTTVRMVPSGGALVGFAIHSHGIDYVITGTAESFENNPKGDFVSTVHKTWRAVRSASTVRGSRRSQQCAI